MQWLAKMRIRRQTGQKPQKNLYPNDLNVAKFGYFVQLL